MTKLKFTLKASPVLPEHRPIYKIAQILFILHFSRARKSSLLRLHLFNWALKTKQRMNILRVATTRGWLSLPTWGFDPALAIAVRFALAEKLIAQVANGYQLDAKGIDFLGAAMIDDDIFQEERSFLLEVGKLITEKMVESVAKDWS